METEVLSKVKDIIKEIDVVISCGSEQTRNLENLKIKRNQLQAILDEHSLSKKISTSRLKKVIFNLAKVCWKVVSE